MKSKLNILMKILFHKIIAKHLKKVESQKRINQKQLNLQENVTLVMRHLKTCKSLNNMQEITS